MIYWPPKAAGEVQDFVFDFSGVLQEGESLADAQVTENGATVDASSFQAGLVTCWLSGGSTGTPAIVTCTVTTDSAPARTYSETAIVPIGEEPVSLPMAKQQVRGDGTTADDDYLLGLIQTAREHVETYCGIRIMPAAVEMSFRSFCELDRLTVAPLQSIVELRYLDTSGVEQVLDAAVYETVNVDADPLRPRIRRAYGQTWPSIRCVEDAVRVSAVVGYTVVPRPIIQAMLLLIDQWYDNRAPISVGGSINELPNSVTALLSNYRRWA